MSGMNIAEVRRRFPQYDDMSDQELADALHQRFYSDMPRADFLRDIGMGDLSSSPVPRPRPDPGVPRPQMRVDGMPAMPGPAAIPDAAAGLPQIGARPDPILQALEAPSAVSPQPPGQTVGDPLTTALMPPPLVDDFRPDIPFDPRAMPGVVPQAEFGQTAGDPLAALMMPPAPVSQNPSAFARMDQRLGRAWASFQADAARGAATYDSRMMDQSRASLAALEQQMAGATGRERDEIAFDIARLRDEIAAREARVAAPNYPAGVDRALDRATTMDAAARDSRRLFGDPTQFPRAFASGAAGATGAAIEGMGLIGRRVSGGRVGEALQAAGRRVLDYAEEIAPDPETSGFATDVVSGTGSMGLYLMPGAAATWLTRGSSAGVRAGAGIGAAATLAGPGGASEQYGRALAAGLSEDEALRISMYGIPAGVVQVAPVGVILRRIPPDMQGAVAGQIRHVAEAFLAEFTAETAGALMQNFIEQSYNAERGVWDDSLYQGLVGGTSAAVIQALIQAATRGRGAFPVERREMPRAEAEAVAEVMQAPPIEAQQALPSVAERGEAPPQEPPAQDPEPAAMDGQQVTVQIGEQAPFEAEVVGQTIAGTVIREPDGTETVLPIEDIEDGEIVIAPRQEQAPTGADEAAEQAGGTGEGTAPGQPRALDEPAVGADDPPAAGEPAPVVVSDPPVRERQADLSPTGEPQADPLVAAMAPPVQEAPPAPQADPILGAMAPPPAAPTAPTAPLAQTQERSDGDLQQQAGRDREGLRGQGRAEEVAPGAIPYRPIREDTAVTARAREVPVTYAVVEADSLIPSNLPDGRVNPAYPQEMQPRDRSRAASQEQISGIAGNLQPRLLGETPQASSGAPIIAPDGVVESGNGRTIGIQRAYAEDGESASRYRAWLEEQGYPAQGLRNPMLVRVRQGQMTPQERQAFAREANERDTQAMSVSEQAMADARAMSPGTLARYRGGDIDAAANRDFVRDFLREAVGEADRGAMISRDGSMSQDAVRRVQAALLARAYGDAGLIANLMEGTDTSIKAIGGALTDVAAQWAQMRERAASGTIDPSVDQTAELIEAVKLVDRARRDGRRVAEFVGQTDMFSGESISGPARAFLNLFFRNIETYTQPVSRDKLADVLRFYVGEAEKTAPGADLLGQTADPQAITAASRRFLERQYDDGQGTAPDLFAQPARDPGDGAREAGAGRERPDPATAETGRSAADQGRGAEASGAEGVGGEASPFAAAGFTRAEKTGDWVLEGKRGERDGRWIIRAHPGDRFRVLRFTDQVGTVSVPTRTVGIFDTSEAAIEAVQAERSDVSDSLFSAERAEGGFYPRAETDQGQRTFRDTLFPTRAEATAAAPEALRRWHEERKVSTPTAQEKKQKAAPETEKVSTPAKPAPTKIEDFGEKIGGARKDTWAGFAERMAEAENFDLAAEPLSKTWPEPNYQAMIDGGADSWSVAFIRAARDTIPRKPSQSWKKARWAEQVRIMRDFAKGVLDGRYSRKDIESRIEDNKGLDAVAGAVSLYETFGHDKSFRDLTFKRSTYSMLNGEYFAKGKTFWEVTKAQKATAFSNMPRVLARGNTKAEALEAFRKVYAGMTKDGETKDQKKADRRAKFIIWSKRGDAGAAYFVGVKIGANYITLREGIKEAKEARRIVSEEADDLQAQLDRMREVPRERRDENEPRVGADHRGGVNVTPEMFQDAFRFRGVEFGNYVEGERRQRDLNEAYDALMDLAGILGVPSQALSLNGTLGLAFGARGTGGKNAAAAHYEPGKIVINLTKAQGRGSLAHEWFHALDNYFARARMPMRGTYITDNTAPGSVNIVGIRPEVVNAFLEVKKAIARTELKKRSSNIDRLRTKDYWGTGIEMHARAFESYVLAKLQDQSASNDYLVNVVNGTLWGMQAELSGLGDSYPYLKPNETEVVRPAFDALFDTIETRQTGRGVEMYSRRQGRMQSVADLRGDELGDWSDIRQLGRKAEAWYRDNLVGSQVVNAATGMRIGFNRTGARKIGGRKGDVLFRIVPALREILRDGDLVRSDADAQGRPNVAAVHTFAATVMLDGQPRDVVAKVIEAADGSFHYDLSRDVRDGARFRRTSIGSEAYGLEDNPADLNLAFRSPADNTAQLLDTKRAAIKRDLRAAWSRLGLPDAVRLKVVDGLFGMDAEGNKVPIDGSYVRGLAQVALDSTEGALNTLHHEAIHMLRDPHLWGRPFGLFTEAEWRALETAAAREWMDKHRIGQLYHDLPLHHQIEEAIAAEFSEAWAAKRAPRSGLLVEAFNKIARFLKALGRALRGAGFRDPQAVWDAILSGEVGRRGPVRGEGSTAPKYMMAGAGAAMQATGLDAAESMLADGATPAEIFKATGWSVGADGRLRFEVSDDAAKLTGRAPVSERSISGAFMDLPGVLSHRRLLAAYPSLRQVYVELSKGLYQRTGGVAGVKTTASGTYQIKFDEDFWTGPHTGKMAEFIEREGGHDKARLSTLLHEVQHIIQRIEGFDAGEAGAEARRDYFRSAGEVEARNTARRMRMTQRERAKSDPQQTEDVPRNEQIVVVAPAEAEPRISYSRQGRPPQVPEAKPLADTSFTAGAIRRIQEANAVYGPPAGPQQLPAPATFVLPQRTGLMALREGQQDRFIMLRAVQDAIKAATGETLPESHDAYLKQTLFTARMADRMDRMRRTEVKALTDQMRADGVSLDDLGIYMLAKHAPERNAEMARRDPERFKQGNGSGVYDEAAQALLDDLREQGKLPALERSAKLVRQMIDADLQLRRTAGLISDEQYQSYRTMYRNYVPLRGFAERDDGGQLGRMGSGFDMRGKEIKEALGRMSIAENPVVQAISMRQEGIVRAEKNRVVRSLLRLVQANPHPELWEVVGKLPTRNVLDPDTGMVKAVVDFGHIDQDHALGVKVGGEVVYMRINDHALLSALNNMQGDWSKVERIMKGALAFMRGLQRTTTLFSRVNTALNLNFTIPNAQSDIMEGAWTAYNADKKGMTAAYLKAYPLSLVETYRHELSDSAMGRMLGRMRGKAGVTEAEMGRYQRYREEWEHSGGRINFMGFRDMDEITRDISREIGRLGQRKAAEVVWGAIEEAGAVLEKFNQPVEGAGRLAMYIAARENGFSREKSAALALDATANYYRQGNHTKFWRALYAFWNPAVQGIEKAARFFQRPKNWPVMGGIMATGYVMGKLAIMAYGDDDDPEGRSLFERIPQFDRHRSIIIPTGIHWDEVTEMDENGVETTRRVPRLEYTAWRVMYQLRPVLALGQEIALAEERVRQGTHSPGQAAAEALGAFWQAAMMSWNPFGDSNYANMAAPTILDPVVDVGLNRTWTGLPVYPDDGFGSNSGIPRSSQFFERSNSRLAVETAQVLNRVTGGTEYEPGMVDIYPGVIDHFFGHITGGLGRLAKQVGGLAADLATGTPTEPHNVPVVRSFVGRTGGWPEQRFYYDTRSEMQKAESRARQAWHDFMDDPNNESARRTWESYAVALNVGVRRNGRLNWTQSLTRVFLEADGQLRDLREELTGIVTDRNLGRRERTERAREIRLQMEAIQRRARERYHREQARNLSGWVDPDLWRPTDPVEVRQAFP